MKAFHPIVLCLCGFGLLFAQESDLKQMDDKVDIDQKEVGQDVEMAVDKAVSSSFIGDDPADLEQVVDDAIQDSVEKAVLNAEEPGRWKYTAGYAIGFAEYEEDGNVFPVKSSWNGWNSILTLRAQTYQWSVYPYFRLRFLNTVEAVEEWKRNGEVFQNNDMRITGGDFSMGFSTQPIDLASATVTPQVGLIARVQNFKRSNFVFIDGARAFFGQAETVTEFVQTYGVGGGFVFDIPLNDTWTFAVDTEVYALYFVNADNDAFDVQIEADGELFWDSSFTLYRKMSNPNYKVGLRLNSFFQWINGGTAGSDFDEGLIEYPENHLRNIGLEFFWQGIF